MVIASRKVAAQENPSRGRKAPKETRRLQLIEATIDSLAKRGYAETTMADVTEGAGLSRGIVNFHFESKEKLLVATLQHMYEEYAAHWRAAQLTAGDNASGSASGFGRRRLRSIDLQQAQTRRLVCLLGRSEVATNLPGALWRPRC